MKDGFEGGSESAHVRGKGEREPNVNQTDDRKKKKKRSKKDQKKKSRRGKLSERTQTKVSKRIN